MEKTKNIFLSLLLATATLTSCSNSDNFTPELEIPEIKEEVVETFVSIPYGHYFKGKLEWGSGEGYVVTKNSKPEVAIFSINENGEYMAQSLSTGQTFVTVTDSEGTTNPVQISVRTGWDLIENSLSVDIEPEKPYTFPIRWGNGKVSISDCSDELKNPWLLISGKDKVQKYDVLQINANKGTSGKLFVELTDAQQNKAIITLNVN